MKEINKKNIMKIIILLLVTICSYIILFGKNTYCFNYKEICKKIKETKTIYDDNIKSIDELEVITLGNIDFIVVKKNKNKALLITKDVIEYNYFSSENDNENLVDWKYSYMRVYLNNNFYNNFSEQEKKMIVAQKLQNPKRRLNYRHDEYDTYDNVFLLSPYEMNKYFNHKEDYTLNEDDQINNAIAYDKNEKKSQYYLRFVPIDFNKVIENYYIVDEKGKIRETNNKQKNGIRPCIVVKYDEDEYSYDNTNITKEDDKLFKDVKKEIKEKLKESIVYDNEKIDNSFFDLDEDKIVDTFLYYRKPSEKYDDYFIYYDCNGFIAGKYSPTNYYSIDTMNDYDDVRTIYSDYLGRVDIFINRYGWRLEEFFDFNSEETKLNILNL